ncbi:hypothetical protein BT96DRAFT_929114, partial [Gymnopus androsaceus JB14]
SEISRVNLAEFVNSIYWYSLSSLFTFRSLKFEYMYWIQLLALSWIVGGTNN